MVCFSSKAKSLSRALELGVGTMRSFFLSDTSTLGAQCGNGQQPEVCGLSLLVSNHHKLGQW